MTPPSSHSCYLLQSGPCHYGFNMALDEALLQALPRLGKRVFRFYSWREPAASFGYFQKIAEVERLTVLRPLVRRPTGGGIVPHDADWTYSLMFPTKDEWYSFTAIESYQAVHEWIRAAFARLNVPAELAANCRKAEPGQCFLGHEKHDLLWNGQKIAGAAQRRTRDGLLIQGSVQPPPLSLAKADWQKAMCDAAHFEQGTRWEAFVPDTQIQDQALDLVRQKYSQDSYNRKR